ncbi:MAG: S53 family peptidase [Nocardioidaceae bacterium]
MTDLPRDPDHLDLTPLPASERFAAPDVAGSLEPLDPQTRVEVTLVLRRRASVPESVLTAPVLRAELAASYGADPADVDLVTSTLGGLGVEIVAVHAGSRRMRVAGAAELLSRVFDVDFELASSRDPAGRPASHRHRTGELSVPTALDGVVVAVLGLDDRPQARALFRIAGAEDVSVSYTPPEVGQLYSFPADTDGSGQTIAIIELGGGFGHDDLDTYFGGLDVTTPTVRAVGVDGAKNKPGKDPEGADAEVLLDIEVAGALAPGADFVVYFAPNTDDGFLDAVSEAAHADPTPTAMSISWGQSEDQWTGQARTALDRALEDAAALGVTVTAAAGDTGSSDRQQDGHVHVDFPASSPHALGCGGTRLETGPGGGTISSEMVWNNGLGKGATGGGVSDVFDLPSWQRSVGVPERGGAAGSSQPGIGSQAKSAGRGVPDLAGNADPQTGYKVRVDGKDTVVGGTSAVSPLWAALVARLAQARGRRFGLIQPALYDSTRAGAVAPGFRDITSGDNGAYTARAGWDACTGLGVPNGQRLLAALDHGGSGPPGDGDGDGDGGGGGRGCLPAWAAKLLGADRSAGK